MNQTLSKKSKFWSESKNSPRFESQSVKPDKKGVIEDKKPEKTKSVDSAANNIALVHGQAAFGTIKKINLSKIQTNFPVLPKNDSKKDAFRKRRQSIASPKLLKEYKYRRTLKYLQPSASMEEKQFKNLAVFGGAQDILGVAKSPDSNEPDPVSIQPKPLERTNTVNSYALSSYFGEDDPQGDEDYRKLKNQQTLRKVLLVSYFLGILFSGRNRVKFFNTLKPKQPPIQFKRKSDKKGILPLLPGNPFSVAWSLILAFLMVVSAIITPVAVGFVDQDDEVFSSIDIFLDVGFGIDIMINFITAYQDPDYGLITDLKLIAKFYLKKWFWIDFLAFLPFDMIIEAFVDGENSTTSRVSKLLELLKFSRLSRLFRILRLFKLLKMVSNNYSLNRILRKLHLNLGLVKLLKVFGAVLIMNHMFGCFWFFWARMQGLGPETWVARNNLIDEDLWTQYLASYYWAFETLTTVGYGDIYAGTSDERILAVFWMLIGVGFYSSTIGNLSSILAEMDRRSLILKDKLTAFNNFASKVKLPELVRQKVQSFIELNHNENVYYLIDPQDDLSNLPYFLKKNLLLYSYYPMIKNANLLHFDANFTVALLLHLKIIKLQKKEILYREDDPAEEIFFVIKGSVNLVSEEGKGIFSFIQGTHFGEIEIFEKIKRLSFCEAAEPTKLLVCDRKIFLDVLAKFPDVETHIRKSMKLRQEKLESKLVEIKQKFATNDPHDKEKQEAHANNRKLLKSTVYFMSLLAKKSKKLKLPSEEPPAEATPRSMLSRGASGSSSKGLATEGGFLSVLRQIHKVSDKSERSDKLEKQDESTTLKASRSGSQINLIGSGTDNIFEKPSQGCITQVLSTNAKLVPTEGPQSPKLSVNLSFDNEGSKDQERSILATEAIKQKDNDAPVKKNLKNSIFNHMFSKRLAIPTTQEKTENTEARSLPEDKNMVIKNTNESLAFKEMNIKITAPATDKKNSLKIDTNRKSLDNKVPMTAHMTIDKDKIIPEEPNSSLAVTKRETEYVNQIYKDPAYIKTINENFSKVYDLKDENRAIVETLKAKKNPIAEGIAEVLEKQKELDLLISKFLKSKEQMGV